MARVPRDTTKLLLHCDGTDGSTTFTDSSDAAHAVTAMGNAQIDTAQSVFGGASGLFDGSGDYLSIADSAGLALGSGDFTIAFRMRPAVDVGGTQTGLLDQFYTTRAWAVSYTASRLYFNWSTNGSSVSGGYLSTTIASGAWTAIAIVRSGSTITMYVNGTSIGTLSIGTDAIYDSGVPLFIGAYHTGDTSASGYFNGHLDEILILKGTALYTGDYSLPTDAYVLSNPTRAARVLGAHALRNDFSALALGSADWRAREARDGLLLGRHRSGYSPRAARAMGGSAALGRCAALVRGAHRQAQDLDAYLLFQAVDGAPFDFDSPADSNDTGVFVVDAPGPHTYAWAVRRRNVHGLVSRNTAAAATLAIDADGALVATPPSAPVEASATATAGGTIEIRASYRYLPDGSSAGTEWSVWLTADGSEPDPTDDPSQTLAVSRVDGVAKLRLATSAYPTGTVVKVRVAVRREIAQDVYATSAATPTVSAVADATGPDQPRAQAFIGAFAAFEE